MPPISVKPLPFSTLQDKDLTRRLVKRVMDDGDMIRLQACLFVAGMVDGATGWDVYRAIDGGVSE